MKTVQLLGREYLIESREERLYHQCGVTASADMVLEQLQQLMALRWGQMDLRERGYLEAAIHFTQQILDEAGITQES